MEFVILGFLMIKSLSQYDLLQALSKEVSPFYQPSLGSIQYGLNKLLKKGCISKSIAHDSKRNKHNYFITKSGIEYFSTWMLSDYNSSKFHMQFNTRLFFLGHLSVQKRIEIMKKTILFVENILQSFRLEEQKINLQVIPKTILDLAIYQVKTLKLGIHRYQSMRSWISKEIEELEKLED